MIFLASLCCQWFYYVFNYIQTSMSEMRNYFLAGVILFLVTACSDSTTNPSPDPILEEYYPITIGSSWTYRTKTLIFADGGDSFVYDTVKVEVIGDTIFQGSIYYKLEYLRNSEKNYAYASYGIDLVRYHYENLEFGPQGIFEGYLFPLEKNKSWESTKGKIKVVDKQKVTINNKKYSNVFYIERKLHSRDVIELPIRADKFVEKIWIKPGLGIIRHEVDGFGTSNYPFGPSSMGAWTLINSDIK